MTPARIRHFQAVCEEAGAIYRGFMPAFNMRDGSVYPAIIFFDGVHWRNTVGLREPDFNLEAVRQEVTNSNRLFSFYNQKRMQHRKGKFYQV
jgi:hypothetical protein